MGSTYKGYKVKDISELATKLNQLEEQHDWIAITHIEKYEHAGTNGYEFVVELPTKAEES